jgi:hypothetical protein
MKKISAIEAKNEAQKIAFAPVVFQAVYTMRETGLLKLLLEAGDNGLTARELSDRSGLSFYGVQVLLDMALAIDVAEKQDEQYTLTKTGFFLESDLLTRVNMDFTRDVCYKGLFSLKESIERGKPEGLKEFGDWPTIYEGLAELPPEVKQSWFAFDHYYSDQVFPEALPLVFGSPVLRLLDVGGNTGKWALACVNHDAGVEVTIMDLPGQLDMARKLMESKGFVHRVKYYPNDLLNPEKPFPGGFDAIWMSQFLDCFSEKEILHILTRARQAMSDKSSLFILEPLIDRQRFPASSFSLICTSLYFTAMANGNSRMYHSGQLLELIRSAGLTVVSQHDHLGVSHTLLECRIAQ